MPQLIEVPGQGVVEFPDGMTDDQIAAAIRGDKQDGKSMLRQFITNLGAGAVRGAGSIGATLLTPIDAAARAVGVQNDFIGRTDRREAMDQGLQMLGADPESLPFKGAKLGTEILGTAGVGGTLARGAAMLPGASRAAPVVEAIASSGMRAGGATGASGMAARTLGGAVTGGGSAALVNPEDAGTGALIGAALPGATKLAGAAGRRIGNALKPNVDNPELAAKAIREYNIPLGASDISSSEMLKGTRSFLDDTMLVGKIGQRSRDRIQEAFNREVGKTFGADAPKLTPDVIDAAKKRMGSEFDRIWGSNVVRYDGDLFQTISELRASAAKLPQGEAGRVLSWLDDFESKAVPGPNNELFIPGDVANRFQSKLRQEVDKATGFLKDDLSNLRRGIISAFNRSVSPDDAAALATNQRQYKAFKTVEPLLQGAEAGVAGRNVGDVPAALLPQAVRSSYKGNIAQSPFADLSQIGSQYVADRVARTGGSARAAIQNTAIGASLLGAGAVTNPAAALGAFPVAAGVESLLSSPRVAEQLLPKVNPGPGLLDQLGLERLLYLGLPVTAASQ